MTGNYRAFLKDTVRGNDGGYADTPGAITITATHDATDVRVRLPTGVEIEPGDGVPAIEAGGEATYSVNAGDVVQLLAKHGACSGTPNHDLSGTLITANESIQVIGSVAITSVPSPEVGGDGYADHLEKTILPAEVLGQEYVLAPPSSSKGKNIGYYVRIYGNFDGTELTYPGGKPSAEASDRIDAGQVVALDLNSAFQIHGTNSFGVGIFGKGGQRHTTDPAEVPTIGDPAYTLAVAVPQFRSRYIFLAPNDYLVSYADVILPKDGSATMDGEPLADDVEEIPGGQWILVRHRLGTGNQGAHLLEVDVNPATGKPYPMSLQVMGYGHATGYMYPGGLDLKRISIPPG